MVLMERYTENNGLVQLHFVPSYFFKIPAGETIDSIQQFVFILDCISSIFKAFIPTIGNEALVIINDVDRDCPTCYKAAHLIALHTRPTRWSQIAYQFSHELCHYCIPDTVDQNLRWFEESVCETASLFFMQVLGNTWQRKNEQMYTTTGELYASEFIRYAADESKKFIPFNLKDPVIRKHLEEDCYDRKRNTYLANHLLQIFRQFPNTWAAIPLLCTLHHQNLEEALDAWILASPPSAQPGLHEIRALF